MTVAAAAPVLAELYPFEPHFHDHGDARQHFVDEGHAAAAPLLMLHGNPTWSFCWRRLIRAFRGEHRVVAPDHVGCGLSDKPQDYDYTLARHVENLERLVLGLDLRRITLVLHDWGGAIGMGFARRHPERVARLVLLNTAAFLSRNIPLRISICRVPVFGALAVRGLNGFARAATRLAVARPLPREVRRGYLLPYDSYANRIATLRFVQDIPLAPGHPSFPELEAIDRALVDFRDRPACIVWGERDWCFTPAFRAEWQRRLPEAEVHALDDAAHYVFEDEPDQVERRIRAFLTAHPLA